MTGGHGHVIPRPDGAKARCGGPALCSVCAAELAQVQAGGDGSVPGDRVTVSMADLVTVLSEAEPWIGGKDNAAFTRLAEAAGVS